VNQAKINAQAEALAINLCAMLGVTVSKAAGVPPPRAEMYEAVKPFCAELAATRALNKRMARVTKHSQKVLKKHARAAKMVAPLQNQVAQMQAGLVEMDPAQWRVKLEKTADAAVAGANGHHFGGTSPGGQIGWPQ
jgi:hypothetical protein